MSASTNSFEIFTNLKRGFLALWLNRRSLMPLTALPALVTFLTLTASREFIAEDASYFTVALLQLPADFTIGLFCSLIILIIMSAPKREDRGKPMMFTMNVMEQKYTLIAGALAHTVFGYFSMGGFAIMDKIAAPLRIAVDEGGQIPIEYSFLIIIALVIALYAIRFALLPILIIGRIDIKSFYKKYNRFGLSVPVFFIKFLTLMIFSTLLLLVIGLIGGLDGNGEGENMDTLTTILVNILSAISSVLAHAWAYAAMAIGLRTMLDNDEGIKA